MKKVKKTKKRQNSNSQRQNKGKNEDISIDYITKIEGHANLKLKIRNNRVEKCELASIEGSRYFEGLLKGRSYDEASEITSRICGICSCAHTICAITAIEKALNVKVSKQTEDLRKLLTIGERIRSHATHLYFLALPDYLGYESAIEMMPKYRIEINNALKLMHLGNSIVKTVGGRDIHPVSATIGGFHRLPELEEIAKTKRKLEATLRIAIETAQMFSRLTHPNFSHEAAYISLFNPKEFPILDGGIKTPKRIFEQAEFRVFMSEHHEPRSTANFVVKEGKSYFTGALARVNNNFRTLSKSAKKILENSGIRFPNKNPFLNNFCQAIEIVHCIEHGISLCSSLHHIRKESLSAVFIKKSHGVAAIEVPRGVLWHEYALDERGRITMANIVTPTTQNLRRMEDDIREFTGQLIKRVKSKERIVHEIEKLIRAYDPCFSCSTHFLNVEWE